MIASVVIARHIVQESVRRRVFAVVLLLTLLFLALFVVASIKAFSAAAPLAFGTARGIVQPSDFRSLTAITLLSLGAFASLFLATVLAVFLTLGAVRGDAERGLLQPLVVRPLGRPELLLGRFVGAATVAVVYILALFAVEVVVVHQAGGVWPAHVVGPAAALCAAVVILVAMSLLGSVFLSATANGIALLMLYGAGLVAGLLGSIGSALGSHTVQTISHDMTLALPFEGFYQAALSALSSGATGLARIVVNLGPFGSSRSAGVGFDLWSVGYFAVVALVAVVAFERRDL